MSKKQSISELTNLLTKSLRHKIGAAVNENEFYASKYSKDYEIIFKQAEKVAVKNFWSSEDKKEIKEQLNKKLKKELTQKIFINNKKFNIMDEEINSALKKLSLYI